MATGFPQLPSRWRNVLLTHSADSPISIPVNYYLGENSGLRTQQPAAKAAGARPASLSGTGRAEKMEGIFSTR